MQHYLNCGIGFLTKNISEDDWLALSKIPSVEDRISLDASETDFKLTIVPSTEDSFNMQDVKYSGAIIFRDSSSLKQMQKNFAFEDIEKFKKAYFPLNTQNKEKILNELKLYGLEKYIEQVDVIVYSYCC